MNMQKVIWGLEELSDRELQEKLWTGETVGEMSSFTEAVSSTFDDSGIGRLLDSNQIIREIPEQVIRKFTVMDSLIRRIPANKSPSEVIQDPLMEKIRCLSKEILSILKKDIAGGPN